MEASAQPLGGLRPQRTMPTFPAGPLTGLAAQVLLLAALAETVGLRTGGWVVGLTCGVIMNLALAQGLSHHRCKGLRAADWGRSPFGDPRGEDLSGYRGGAAGRNVVVVHLESTAARYLRPYGARYDPMPNLTRWSRQAILFENAYTAYPETIKSFFAAQCGRWPALDTTAEDTGGLEPRPGRACAD